VSADHAANETPRNQADRSWILLVGICVASTLGLASIVLPLLEQRIDSPWPWQHTQRFLLLAFPVTVLAAILYLNDQQRRATAVHRELLQQRERETERARRQSARLSALLNVSHIMGSEVSLQNVFDAVTKLCREAFACEQVSLMLVDKAAQELVVRSASGHREPEKLLGRRQKLGEGIAGRVAADGKPLLLGSGTPDPAQFHALRRQTQPLAAAMVVPILVRDELVGILNVASKTAATAFDSEDLQSLQVFAENVGACIRHAEQAEWMRQLIQRYGATAQTAPPHRPPGQAAPQPTSSSR
jgi:transcriptional regulator with GAF, ATPase, and Fis domain